MNVVVLDGHTLNPGDLDWAPLRALGPCEIHDRTSPDQVVSRSSHAGIVLTNKTPITAGHIRDLPGLRCIGVLATGFNVVDVAAARHRRIPVTNVPTYGTASVAQHTFALLLELTQHAGHHHQTVLQGRWSASPDFCYWDHPLVELAGRTIGLVGLGRIGRAVARIAQAFNMEVIAATRTAPDDPPPGIHLVSLEALFRGSDVISLHCPLTPETRQLVNAERLSWTKPTAFLLNTSRGPLVDEPALAGALNAGRLAGAGLDVLGTEPPAAGSPLIGARNCIITPHIAWATRAARARLMDVAVANVAAFLQGRPQNVVNPL